jgi:hypothetical protein
MSGRDPATKQRSPWVRGEDMLMDGEVLQAWRRNVHDGRLNALVGSEPNGRLHMSVSHSLPRGGPGRYPTWDELAHARYELLPGDLTFAMMLPPLDAYVADHPTTFHLFSIAWE